MNLQGAYTAIVTPFRAGNVDIATLRSLVERQVAAGVAGLVPVGTTGESPTLSIEEHRCVIETVIAAVGGRCQVIAGTGANATDEAIELTRHAREAGADATLQVTPYYNKPTQEGLYRHFVTIADTCGLPVVLYNVPGRCGVPIEIDTIRRLAAHPLVVAVKEAGGSVDRASAIRDACDLTVLSGDDALTLPMLAVGARGVISVAANLVPERVRALCDAWFADQPAVATRLHAELYPLFRDLFLETNPIPIKAAMAMAGLIAEEYRLPLCPMTPKHRDTLAATLRQAGIL
jgi:4-hydroxy-tetrahydrodipicolinate synthase